MVKEIKMDLPYPDFSTLTEDIRSVSIISPAYAGLYSELTAILQYGFHAHYFEKYKMDETADILIGISLAEMHHFDILGALILQLGVKPIYTTTLPRAYAFFNTSTIAYSTTPEKMLLDDINGELNAIADYEKMIKELTNEKVAAVISRIVLDEKLHVTVLKEQLNKLMTEKKSVT